MKKFYLSFGVQYTREPHPVLWNVPNLPERLLEVEFEDEVSVREWAKTGPLQNKYAFIYDETDPPMMNWFKLGTFTYDFEQGRMVGGELSTTPKVTLEWSPNDDSPPCIDFTCVCGYWKHLCDGPEWVSVDGNALEAAPGVRCPECGVAWSLYRVSLTGQL